MKRSSNFIPHLFASISVIVWGVTFVSTKVLIGQGLTPLQIFVYRFALAYVCMLPLMRRLWANSLKDEICLALGGLSGGSLYFLTENTALGITFASNVSLLICTAPIFTIILDRIIWKTPLRKSLLGGSLIALVGVAVVIINGNLEFKISPLGDFLTIVAAILWAIYSIIVRKTQPHIRHILHLAQGVFLWSGLRAATFHRIHLSGRTFTARPKRRVVQHNVSRYHGLDALLHDVERLGQSPRRGQGFKLYLRQPACDNNRLRNLPRRTTDSLHLHRRCHHHRRSIHSRTLRIRVPGK